MSDTQNRIPVSVRLSAARSYLVRIVHLPRQFGIKEAHQLFELYSWVAGPPTVEFGLWVIDSSVTGSNMVVEVVLCRLNVVISMAIIKCSFL